MTIQRRTLLRSAAAAATIGTGLGGLPWRGARAQAANTIRLGVLTDMSGMYRDVTGPTSVACTRLAAQEFAGQGFTVEVLFADNQNRADIGVNVVRQWFDQAGVDAVVDLGASSVALAVNDVVREKNKVQLNTSSATVARQPILECSPLGFGTLGFPERALRPALRRANFAHQKPNMQAKRRPQQRHEYLPGPLALLTAPPCGCETQRARRDTVILSLP